MCGNIKTSTEAIALGNSKINRGRKRLEELREAAHERMEARTGRSNSEQIELLDARLGKDCGAVKERKRLEGVKVDSNAKNKKASGSTRQARKKEKAARHRAREESRAQ